MNAVAKAVKNIRETGQDLVEWIMVIGLSGIITVAITVLFAPYIARYIAIHSAELPRYHGYRLFTTTSPEPSGYGMYTYVLSGNEMSLSKLISSDLRKRYDALLQAIVAEMTSVAALSASAIPTKETNLFCIPANVTNGADEPTSENYSSQLATSYRLFIERRLASRDTFLRNLENHTGPFLVSTLTRLMQTDFRSANPVR